MGRYAFGLTLPSLRGDPSLSAGGLGDAVLGLIASGSFAGYLAGLLLGPVLGRRFGPRSPTTVGSTCGLVGGALAAAATSPVVLALGTVLAGSAAGWVWAAYSDLAAVVVDAPRRPRTLAVISTGTSAGLVVSGLVGLAAIGVPGWRLVWVAIGLASAAAGLLNLRWTPRVPPPRTGRGGRLGMRGLAVPVLYSVAFHVGVTTFFTWAADMLRRAALAPGWAPALYALVGVVGLVGLGIGGWCARFAPSASPRRAWSSSACRWSSSRSARARGSWRSWPRLSTRPGSWGAPPSSRCGPPRSRPSGRARR